jgi:hypothetical protein
MSDLVRGAGVFDTARQPLGDPQPTLDLGQQQNAAIRRQLTAVKSGDDRLAADR